MLIDFLFLDKDTCYYCQEENIYKYKLCKTCYDKLDYVDNSFKIQGYDAYAIYFYDGLIKKLIGDYKFERKTAFAHIFAPMIYEYGIEKDLFAVDYILPSPSSKARHLDRGFDHIKMICDEFIEKINPVYLVEFEKIKKTKAQHDLDKKQRSTNLKDAFICNKNLTGKSVLIIDDLITTGNTAKEIIRELEKSHVGDIKILALASEKRVL